MEGCVGGLPWDPDGGWSSSPPTYSELAILSATAPLKGEQTFGEGELYDMMEF
jgi:hypothetical protein